MVLRITRYDGVDSGAILRLDGRLVAEGAAILERHCAGRLRRPEGLNLDLVGIRFVDRAGIEVIRRIARAGAEIRCPSGPVASVLVGAGARVVLDAEPAEPAVASVSTALRTHSSHPLFATTLRNHPSQPAQRHKGGVPMRGLVLFAATALTLSSPAISTAATVVFEATGETPAEIQDAVDDFRDFLGPLNPNAIGSFPSGRREINWDAVPDLFAAPNNLPAGFFNANSPRGAVFFTNGTGFQVSADDDNPTGTPILFGNLHPNFPQRFTTFSPQRLFTALGSNVMETLFFVPGSTTPATIGGFGVVFTDVNRADSTKIEFLNARGNLVFSRNVLPGSTNRGSLSFLGVGFDAGEKIFLVRITSGNRAPRTAARDVVMMDDFIYSEPQALP